MQEFEGGYLMDYLNAGDLTKAPFFRRLFAWVIDLIIAIIISNIIYTFVFYPIFDKQWNLTELEKNIAEIQSNYEAEVSSIEESLGSSIESSELQEIYQKYADQAQPYVNDYNPKMFYLRSASTIIVGTAFSFILPLVLKNGQTIGKKLMKIALAKTDGTKMDTGNLIRRYFIGALLIETILVDAVVTFMGMPISYVIPLFTALMVPFFPLGRCIHDYVGGTVVVDISQASIMTREEKEEYIRMQDQYALKDVIDVQD